MAWWWLMNIDVIKSIPDIELRIEMLVKSLKVNFFTEPTISYFFDEDEINELMNRGILTKTEGYLFNKRVIRNERNRFDFS
jgi:uncharacterized protein YqgQ